MEIRVVNENDAATYWKLRLEALKNEQTAFGMAAEEHESTTIEQTAARIRGMPKSSFLLGAFEAGAMIATAMFVRQSNHKERHKGHVYGVYVTPPHRGKGVGEQIMRALLAKVKEDPAIEQVLLAVATRQEAASRLYRKLGFEVYGVEPGALKVGSEYVDEAHMILRLR